MIKDLENKINDFQIHVSQLRAVHTEKTSRLQSQIVRADALQKKVEIICQCKNLLEQCNIASRDFIKNEVEQLTTQALRATLNDPDISFTINFEIKRNQVEADFILTKGADKRALEEDILKSSGGGIADIISFALKIITLELLKIPGPLILDEPGKCISEHYIDNFGKFVAQVSQTFNRQVIMVTHNARLAQFASNTIEVTQVNGKSKITQESRTA